MEDWLAAIPSPHQEELTKRLKSRDNHHFDAAFFELYLHALFRRFGYWLTLSPRSGEFGKHADLLATGDGQDRIVIEAASVCELSDAARAEKARLSEVYDALNRVDCSKYYLNVTHHGALRSPLPGENLRRELKKFVDGLDYQKTILLAKHGLASLPRFEFKHERFRLDISVRPVSPERLGLTGHRPLGMMGPGEFHIVDNHTAIKQKVCQKARQHRNVQRPLIIAINAAGRDLEHMDIMEALFGQEAVTFPDGGGQPVEHRVPNGALMGPSGSQNRNVSAVFFVSSLLPSTIAITNPVIYYNPWARYPLNSIAEGEVSQYRPESDKMVCRDGKPVHELFGLPEGWPGFTEERTPVASAN